MKWRYEESTKTIRSIPENYWIATMDSWDGAVNHAANSRLIAAAPDMYEALQGLAKEINLSKLNIKNAHAYALKALAKAEGR